MREKKERPKTLRQAKNRYGHEKPEKTGPVRTGQAGRKTTPEQPAEIHRKEDKKGM